MPDAAAPPAAFATPADARKQALRALGARAHQVHAATRAADHFVAAGVHDDRDTGCWLMSCAVDLAADITQELDAMARAMKEAPAEPALGQAVQRLRVRAHQLHAAAKGADHFLDLDSRDDRDTGCWLIACARGLAEKLAAEIDDAPAATALRGAGNGGSSGVVVDAGDGDGAMLRRVSHVPAPAPSSMRGIA